MDGITLTALRKIRHSKGDVLHAMKKTDPGFFGFGEAYFSKINFGEVKGWKKHSEMVLNLIVISGEVEFILFNQKEFFSVKLSQNNYQRLSVQPEIWLAFKGIGIENLILNIANIEHDFNESKALPLDAFDFNWDGV